MGTIEASDAPDMPEDEAVANATDGGNASNADHRNRAESEVDSNGGPSTLGAVDTAIVPAEWGAMSV